MVGKELFDRVCFVCRCMIDEKYDLFDAAAFAVRNKVGQVFPKLDVTPAFVRVPDDALLGP